MAKRYSFLTRCLAAVALFFMYVVGASAVLVGATKPAQAWRGRGYYGYGFGPRAYYVPRAYYYAPPPVYYYGPPRPRCYWSYRWQRTVCRW